MHEGCALVSDDSSLTYASRRNRDTHMPEALHLEVIDRSVLIAPGKEEGAPAQSLPLSASNPLPNLIGSEPGAVGILDHGR